MVLLPESGLQDAERSAAELAEQGKGPALVSAVKSEGRVPFLLDA